MQETWEAARKDEDGQVKMSFGGDEGDDVLELFEATGYGKSKLGLNGFVYHNTGAGTSGEWFCDYPSCPGMVTTDQHFNLVKFPAKSREHIHPPDEMKVAEERVLKRIKEKVMADVKANLPKIWQVLDRAMEEYKEDGGNEEIDRETIYKRMMWWRAKAANELGVNKVEKKKKPKELRPEAKYPGDAGDNVLERMISKKGHPMINMNGYLYHVKETRERPNSRYIIWRCEVKLCHGGVRTDKEGLHGEVSGLHTHPPDHKRVERKRLDAKLEKHIAAGVEEGKNTSELLDSFTAGLPEELVALLPNRKSLTSRCLSIKKRMK